MPGGARASLAPGVAAGTEVTLVLPSPPGIKRDPVKLFVPRTVIIGGKVIWVWGKPLEMP